MPSIQFGLSSYERAEGDLPELPVINMYAEEAPTEETGLVLQSRRGLATDDQLGVGPVQALYQRDGVVNGSLFGVSGHFLYKDGNSAGVIPAVEGHPVSIAGNEIGLLITAGASLRYYNGTTLAPVSFPDSASVSKVFQGASRFLAIRADTGKFYWSPPLTATFAALNFATAESAPDKLLDGLYIDDIAVLFGAETVEFWPNTSDDDLPFQPLEGRVIEKGIKATGCAAAIGSTFAWVTNTNQVCLQDENNIISNPGLEKRIEQSSVCSLWPFQLGGIEFIALTLTFSDGTGETHVWSWRSKLWSEFQSYGQDNWIAQCYAGGVFGSFVNGTTYTWATGYTDAGASSSLLERRFRAGFWGAVGTTIANVLLQCQVGQTPFQTGNHTEPVVEMRTSLDNGRTWGDWRSASLGAIGEFFVTPSWRALGMLRRWKGFLAEFRVTSPVDWRVSDVKVNEPYGGR